VDDKSPVRGTETETGTERETWPGGTDVTISIGKRFDIDTILTKELQGTERSGGTTVMVCGPAGMADEVRVAVARLGQKRGVVVRLVEESFSW
jgi:ferredoxin-NADP reductase